MATNHVGIGICVASLPLLSGCHKPPRWQQAVRNLDQIALTVEEWGTVTVSEALLIENEAQFGLGYNRSTGEYIDAARSGVQGAVRRSFEKALDIQTAIGVTSTAGKSQSDLTTGGGPDTDAAKAAGEVEQTEPAVEAEEPPADAEYDEGEGAPKSRLPLDRPAKEVLSTDRFTMPLPIGGLPSAISERQALLVGVNDKATENMLKYLLDPGVGIGENKQIYLGILQVSCQPGWRTRRGYVAEVTVRMAYARPNFGDSTNLKTGYRPEKGQLDLDSGVTWLSSRHIRNAPQPYIVSVFPSLEAQTLDLRNSFRSQLAIAASLSATLSNAGLSAQAENLTDYVKRLEQDAATRTAIPILNSYSDGLGFGYQIQPALEAIGDASSAEGGSEYKLNPVTFPALIVIACDRDILETSGDPGGWTHIEFLVSSRWIPASAVPQRIRRSEMDLINTAILLDNAKVSFSESVRLGSCAGELRGDSHAAHEIQRRIKLYETLGIGLDRYSRLPTEDPGPKEPDVTTAAPPEGWMNADTMLAIKGDGFAHKGKSVVKQVTVGGVACEFVVAGKTTIVGVVPGYSFLGVSGPQPITVTTTKGSATLSAGVTFVKTRGDPPPGDARVDLERDTNGNISRLEIHEGDGASGQQLLDLLKDVLRDGNCCDNVMVEMSSSSSVK